MNWTPWWVTEMATILYHQEVKCVPTLWALLWPVECGRISIMWVLSFVLRGPACFQLLLLQCCDSYMTWRPAADSRWTPSKDIQACPDQCNDQVGPAQVIGLQPSEINKWSLFKSLKVEAVHYRAKTNTNIFKGSNL